MGDMLIVVLLGLAAILNLVALIWWVCAVFYTNVFWGITLIVLLPAMIIFSAAVFPLFPFWPVILLGQLLLLGYFTFRHWKNVESPVLLGILSLILSVSGFAIAVKNAPHGGIAAIVKDAVVQRGRAYSHGDWHVPGWFAGVGNSSETRGNSSGGGNTEQRLVHAVREGDVALVTQILAHGGDVHTRTPMGDTLLMEAAVYGYRDMVEALLAQGADPGQLSNEGETALSLAQKNYRYDIVKILEARKQGLAKTEQMPDKYAS